MGKRKSARKPGAGRTKQAPLDKTFRCLFCQHNGTITCKMDSKNRLGRLDCKDCGQHFSADINHLSQPIDVYSEWIDATEAANSNVGRSKSSQPRQNGTPSLQRQPSSNNANSNSQKRAAPVDDDDIFGDDDDEEELPDLDISKNKKRKSNEEEEEEEEPQEEEEEEPEAQESEPEERTARKGRVVESDEDDD